MLLLTYFTTYRVLLPAFLLSVINTIITTPQDAIINRKTVDRFLFPTIYPIIGTPYYESIADIHIKLNSNAASVQSNLWCGTLCLLFLTISPAVYVTLSTIVFVLSVNPTYGITTQNPPISSPSTKTRTKSFVSFYWHLPMNCMSDTYATNTLATGRRLLEHYWTISTLHTLTFPPSC